MQLPHRKLLFSRSQKHTSCRLSKHKVRSFILFELCSSEFCTQSYRLAKIADETSKINDFQEIFSFVWYSSIPHLVNVQARQTCYGRVRCGSDKHGSSIVGRRDVQAIPICLDTALNASSDVNRQVT